VAKSIKQIIRKRSKYTNIRTTTNSVQIYKKINKSLITYEYANKLCSTISKTSK